MRQERRRLILLERMTAGANEVRGHFSCTFVFISRILHAPSSLLTALRLTQDLSTSNNVSQLS